MRRLVGAFGALVMVCMGTSVAGAAPPKAVSDHCVVRVVGQRISGELLLGDPSCYATFEEAMAQEDVDAWGAGASEQSATASTFTIGIHYDGFNFSGASTSVVGSDCLGGWLNVSATWNNRISSTRHGCPRIRHFDGTNLTGAQETTLSPGACRPPAAWDHLEGLSARSMGPPQRQ